MDYLFLKGRTAWVMFDKEATKIGSIFERDMANGEALTSFEGKITDVKHVETSFSPVDNKDIAAEA